VETVIDLNTVSHLSVVQDKTIDLASIQDLSAAAQYELVDCALQKEHAAHEKRVAELSHVLIALKSKMNLPIDLHESTRKHTREILEKSGRL
jgi:hypothetical protein